VHRYFFVEARNWAHTRNITYTLFCINTTDKDKPELSDFMPLLIDSIKTPEPEMTPERKDEMMNIANERLRILQANKILKL
jgi:hypothetical protein